MKTRNKEEKEFQNGIKEVELHLPVICLCISVLHTKNVVVNYSRGKDQLYKYFDFRFSDNFLPFFQHLTNCKQLPAAGRLNSIFMPFDVT